MFLRIALMTLLLCTGCTRDPVATASSSGLATPELGNVVVGGDAASSATPFRRHSFANLPDVGDLVTYPAQRVVRQDGAYTWHRAGLSEEHALGAVGGVMQITTPAGERLQFQYERHVEHASGDWTWIGRAKGGAASEEVVLTFGEKAAFGSIAQPGKAPLKLTMNGGASWLIETDRSRIAGIYNSATRPRKPDFLIPPKVREGSGASVASSTASAPSTPEAAQSAATTTVDVLLGYTSGFAAAQGGQSQAVTRLNNMVEITNQAYANSQVDARIRLVRTLQVSYPDNTSNDSALEALTGFRAPSTRTTPDPAFAALRAARNQYGADLVSLVRDFNSPENDGCGIAWLIGGGQTGIDGSDEYFGYSVISDGRDVGADGKTYFCREETLAHELGHNMGSQHDQSTATVDGALKYGIYPYSFGFKTAAGAGNLYTVMAYGDSGQTGYRTFSNPRSTYCGGPCGTENQADNARSLIQTMPMVSVFRANVVPAAPKWVRNDIDGDGKSDLVFQNAATREVYSWLMDFITVRASVGGSYIGPGYTADAIGDFDGDGRSDVVWSNEQHIVMLRGTSTGATTGHYVAAHPAGSVLLGSGDIDGDGKSDLVWQNSSTREVFTWLMNFTSVRASVGGSYISSGYTADAIGDFDADGRADVVWSNQQHIVMLRGASTGAMTGHYVASHPAGSVLLGSGDVDGDGKTDLWWQNSATREVYAWLMSFTSVRASIGGSYIGTGYTADAIGDFNGDGRSDIVWSNQQHIVMLRGTSTGATTGHYVAQHPGGSHMVGPVH